MKGQKKEKAQGNQSDVPLEQGVPPNQPQQTSDINYGKGESIVVLHVAEKPNIAQVSLCGTNQRYGLTFWTASLIQSSIDWQRGPMHICQFTRTHTNARLRTRFHLRIWTEHRPLPMVCHAMRDTTRTSFRYTNSQVQTFQRHQRQADANTKSLR